MASYQHFIALFYRFRPRLDNLNIFKSHLNWYIYSFFKYSVPLVALYLAFHFWFWVYRTDQGGSRISS